MDPSLIEAGKDLYGTRWQTFRHVTWPAAFQGVAAGCVLVFLPAVGDFVSAQLLGGPDTYMVGNLIQQQFLEAGNWPFGVALTIVMMAFLLIFMLVYLRSRAAQAPEAGARLPLAATCRAPAPPRFDRPRFLRVFFIVFMFFIFAPLVVVALFSFNSTPSLQNFTGFSLAVVRRVLSQRQPARVAVRQHRDRDS